MKKVYVVSMHFGDWSCAKDSYHEVIGVFKDIETANLVKEYEELICRQYYEEYDVDERCIVFDITEHIIGKVKSGKRYYNHLVYE